jgi:DNA-binding response OmpR family regulator
MLKEWLESDGYQVCAATRASEALKLFFERRPGLAVVDLRMPGMDGFQLIGRLRELSLAPILVLSAISDDEQIVRGLDLGADDYVTKPVSRGPFLARIRSLLRRSLEDPEPNPVYADAALTLDPLAHTVAVRGQPTHLSPLEFRLLAYLVQQRHRIVTHEELLNRVWGGVEMGSPDSLKWYVSSVRRKLELDPDAPGLIVNVRSVGYCYLPPD